MAFVHSQNLTPEDHKPQKSQISELRARTGPFFQASSDRLWHAIHDEDPSQQKGAMRPGGAPSRSPQRTSILPLERRELPHWLAVGLNHAPPHAPHAARSSLKSDAPTLPTQSPRAAGTASAIDDFAIEQPPRRAREAAALGCLRIRSLTHFKQRFSSDSVIPNNRREVW
jgi:hypothetical protein